TRGPLRMGRESSSEWRREKTTEKMMRSGSAPWRGDDLDLIDDTNDTFQALDGGGGEVAQVIRGHAAAQSQNALLQFAGEVLEAEVRVAAEAYFRLFERSQRPGRVAVLGAHQAPPVFRTPPAQIDGC